MILSSVKAHIWQALAATLFVALCVVGFKLVEALHDRDTARTALANEQRFRASLPGAHLTQGEYDVYLDFVYHYGAGAWSKSSMRRELLAGNHLAACDALLRYRYVAGYDCSTPGNRRCMGVWTRQQARHKTCLEAQP